ncbi:hypothetical protein [Sedimentibacter sp. MB31-C6]|uniref:hypothetical protein n=1 Tax=Sedimentibacter sp. MB31-C6 TaxID=3109366 RepID=UPI002DDD4DCA|nr:hypothetical protein [Sedimentibacter sp. MB36-C1]WSI04110.1 hypothetical protein U8307_14085 [Sedimentibacter sp. MB36-C1]
MDKEKLREVLENFKLFFQAATDYNRKSRSLLVKESHNEMDEFLLLCFGDSLGIPIPTSYYSLELLPLIAEDLESWQFRMGNRLNIWEEKWGDYGFDA